MQNNQQCGVSPMKSTESFASLPDARRAIARITAARIASGHLVEALRINSVHLRESRKSDASFGSPGVTTHRDASWRAGVEGPASAAPEGSGHAPEISRCEDQ